MRNSQQRRDISDREQGTAERAEPERQSPAERNRAMLNINEMSRDERREAKQKIEARTQAVIEAYRNSDRASDIVQSLVDIYGYNEAVEMVALVVNRVSLGDGRIYDGVREWAQMTNAPSNEELHSLGIYGVDTWIHTVYVNEIGLAMRKYEPTEEEAEEGATVAQVEKYREEHGERACLDLLYLLGPDHFSGDYEIAVSNLKIIVDRQTTAQKEREERERKQAETDKENFEHCRSIADELTEVAEGVIYKCPHCGEWYSIEDADETDNGHICPNCSEEIEDGEAEQVSLWDYFNDALDIEYVIGSDGKYRAVRLMVACGGPNIYIDTASALVELYWWGDRAEAHFDRSTADEIDEAFEELYEMR